MLKIEDLFDNWSPLDAKSIDELWGVLLKLPDIVGKENSFGMGMQKHEPSFVVGPARFGEGCKIGHASFVGANFYAEDNVVVGFACEVKNSYVGYGTKIAHMNYLSHTIVGRNCNLGAGAKIANSKVHLEGEKRGALIGDNVYLGIGVLVHPETIIGKNSWVYPGAILRGEYPPSSIVKVKQTQTIVSKK